MSIECKRILMVLGMHRSGTSALTRGLEVLGAELGQSLMPAAKDNNDKGFFEDVDFHALNSRLLAHLGSAWDRLGPLPAEYLQQPGLSALLDQAERILAEKLAQVQCLAIKDPQASLLLPFWQQVFSRLGVRVQYLICFRNPLSVAASLRKRDDIYPVHAQLLWAKYSLAALQHTLSQEAMVVDYDDLMETPQEQLRRIARGFGLPMPDATPEALAAFSQEFLTHELRHSRFNDEHLAAPGKVLQIVRDINALLKASARLDGASNRAPLAAECRRLTAGMATLEPIAWELDTLSTLETPEDLLRERDALLAQAARLQGECQDAWAEHAKVLEQLDRIRNHPLFRVLRTLKEYRTAPRLISRGLSHVARIFWQHLPGSTARKNRAKDWLFRHAGPLFQRNQAYQNWLLANGQQGSHSIGAPIDWLNEPIQQVKRLHTELPARQVARQIAFYLPQFHAIPENDAWWGEGFTEWTNVRPAQPHYRGHYQPHIPGELGYYNLDDPDTQRRQVELAKLYGIAGFCFYFYWFGGKRLLEKPIENYLGNRDLDLPFCLCWANENWSRRWDGLDDQILIGQKHSTEDDLAFIAHIANYMRDERYIRIDGKPLLLVYRPGELPNAKATASRWRSWCREHGVGEIYLAYTQSFDKAPPSRYGFDAAVEFPPNGTQPRDVTSSIQPLQDNFLGKVYDWRTYLKRSAKPSQPKYPLFRGVCPSWDNTARRKERGTSFINSSPRGYQEWLFNAIRDTVRRFPAEDQRLVFINAWNEWAEGAHLEPDQRYGYSFLEASRMAGLRAALHSPQSPAGVRPGVAVVIHAYYMDVFGEILDYIRQIRHTPLKLYISTPAGQAEGIHALLADSTLDYHLQEVPNHGRDVLPFLKLLPRIIEDGFATLVKVHTKKSTHRQDGDNWRRDLYTKLLNPQALADAQADFASDPTLGILGPAGHVVPMSFYWGSNALAVEKLACRLGINPAELSRTSFVAGTMFFARTDALLPLMNLALSDEDFEAEAGQVDGTFAHALERAIAISAQAAGLKLRSCDGTPSNKRYAYADATL